MPNSSALKWVRGIVQYWPLFPHVLGVLLVVWGCGYFALISPIVIMACALLYLYLVDMEQRKWLRARLERRWIQEQVQLSAGAANDNSVETWLNALVRACWPAWEAGLLSKILEARLAELLEPRKVTLERFRLGSSPPLVRSCEILLPRSQPQHHPSACDAALDMDLSYIAGDDMGVVLTVPMRYFAAKLFCDNLKIDCKLRLGLKFVAYSPYISYLTVSFLTVPSLGLSLRPLSSNSLAVTDLPIIASWVTNSIHMAVQTCGLVHPEKWDLDIIQWWGTDYGLRPNLSGREGGCYAILEIIEGRDLMAKDISGFSDPYVIVTHGSYKFKTETRKQTLNPSWHECFRMGISESSWKEKVLLRCRDRDIIIDDELGFYELDLSPYWNGKRCEVLCKLQNADSGELVIAVTVVGAEKFAHASTHQESRSPRPPSASKPCSHITTPDHSGSADRLLYPGGDHDQQNGAGDAGTPTKLTRRTRRSLSGSLLFCPGVDTPPINAVVDGSSTSSPQAAGRPRKSLQPELKKPRNAVLLAAAQKRRSTIFFDGSSCSRGSTTSGSSQKRTKSTLPRSSAPNVMVSDGNPQVQIEKVGRSKKWKRNLFQFAFHKVKQQRQPHL